MKKTFTHKGYKVAIEGPRRNSARGIILRAYILSHPSEAKKCSCRTQSYATVLQGIGQVSKSKPQELERKAEHEAPTLESRVKSELDRHLLEGHSR